MISVTAPWTQEQIDALNERQRDESLHPYTCGNDSMHRLLMATPDGWVCPDCDYRQRWAHEADATGATLKMAASMREWLHQARTR